MIIKRHRYLKNVTRYFSQWQWPGFYPIRIDPVTITKWHHLQLITMWVRLTTNNIEIIWTSLLISRRKCNNNNEVQKIYIDNLSIYYYLLLPLEWPCMVAAIASTSTSNSWPSRTELTDRPALSLPDPGIFQKKKIFF